MARAPDSSSRNNVPTTLGGWREGIYLNGSFVEAKGHPNDIDGYFTCDARRIARGELQRELNQIDPKSAWTWDPASRRPYRGYAKKQLPMWHAYRVELYPIITRVQASETKMVMN